jgi:hypothetical protein
MVFGLMDRSDTGVVPQNELAFNLIKLQSVVGDQIDLNKIADFEQYQNDTLDITFESFTATIALIAS